MLTPVFELTQDDNFVVIRIKTPHIRAPTDDGEVEIFFQDRDFEFYAKPYLLRLTLPGSVLSQDNAQSKAQYVADETAFIIHMPKLTRGEHFDGLDLLTKLLTPKHEAASSNVPLIEVIGGTDDNLNPTDQDYVFDWSLPQPLCSEDVALLGDKYGFANQYHGVICKLQETLPDLVQVRNPDKKSFSERSKERQEAEVEKFDEEYYLADFYEDNEVKKVMEFDPPWVELCRKLDRQQSSCPTDLVTFTEDEKETMMKLPRKEYLLDKPTKTRLLFGLVDILFGYAYDMRTTEAEHTVESPWTICTLSATLSWLETCTSLFSTCVTCVRRSLCYPLYRNWDLAMLVMKDVTQILRLGQKYVLKCLLDIHNVLKRCESRYILNELYITDYCVWMQSVKSETLQSLAEALANVKITKDDVKLDLVRLHIAADLVVRDEMRRNSNQASSSQAADAGVGGGLCVPNQCASVDPLCSDLTTLTITTRSQAGNLNAASNDSLQSSSDDDDDDDDSSASDESDSSSDRTDSDDDSLDSDDYTSSEVASSDSDDDDDDDDSSSDSDSSDESCTMLLKTMKNTERKR